MGRAARRRSSTSSPNVEDGYGFLIEAIQYATGTAAARAVHVGRRRTSRRWPSYATAPPFIGLVRDHGAGQVTIDEAGQAVPWYSLDRPASTCATCHRALDAQVRLHVAAGARQIEALAAGLPDLAGRATTSRRYIERLQRIPLRAGGFRLFSAHQMGTCRMGADPQTSVAEPRRRAARHARRVDRRRQRVPDPLGHQPDDHDHGPGPPHGRGDRRGRAPPTADGHRIRRTHGHDHRQR